MYLPVQYMYVKKYKKTISHVFTSYKQWPYNKNESLCNVSVSVIIIIVGPTVDSIKSFDSTKLTKWHWYLFLSLEKLCGWSQKLVVDAADPVVGIGLHGGAVLAPVLPEEDVHHDAVHRAAHIPGFQQLRHSPSDQLNRVDRTAPDVTPNI